MNSFPKNLKMGVYCVIEDDVIIGDNVTLGNYVMLKSGTVIGNNVTIADYCCTTGICYIGDNTNIRTRATISRGVIIEGSAFIGGGVMTSHTKKPPHMRNIDKKQYLTRIGFGAIIGSGSCMRSNVNVGDNVFVGYCSHITHDLVYPGIYWGNPARFIKELPSDMYIELPEDLKPYEFDKKLLKKYLPFY